MPDLITNQEKLLGDLANDIIPVSKGMDFLVGYFYFSGFREIYENIDDKKIRILVGLNAEPTVSNAIKESAILKKAGGNHRSRKSIREDYYQSLSEIIGKTDYFEQLQNRKAFNIFIEKVQNGSLQIKRTKEPNHAKMYLFEYKSEPQKAHGKGTFITGSSNLSYSGLRGRYEINAIFRSDDDFQKGQNLFNELWEDAVELVGEETLSEFEKGVLDTIWINNETKFTPYEVYLRVLSEYFLTDKDADSVKYAHEITEGEYFDLKYQKEAIAQSMYALDRHDGILIADVVGLGKSIIASSVAHNLGLQTVIIAPPHLENQWEDYIREFNFKGEVYGSGQESIAQAARDYESNREKLIIVDEAHKYRNEDTQSHAELQKLCLGNKVLLLTATPFNNHPKDILSLLKLFQIISRSTIRTVDNLSYEFNELIQRYKEVKRDEREGVPRDETEKEIRSIAKDMREMIYPLVIRRSRIDLESIEKFRNDLEQQNIKFPEVEPPRPVDYKLGEELSEKYEKTLEDIAPETEEEGFIGARYKPAIYIKEEFRSAIAEKFDSPDALSQAQINVASFMKRLLVKRFESSGAAFQSTLNNLIKSSEKILHWYNELGRVPIYKKGHIPEVESLELASGEEVDTQLDKVILEDAISKHVEKGMVILNKKQLKIGFVNNLENDLEKLRSIQEMWKGEENDPKLDSLIDKITKLFKENPERKIIIFSEYADTVNYLHKELQDDFRVLKYSSSTASKKHKRTVKVNFDASVPDYDQENDYDILVATDAISEGYNLNRAGVIFNYDIPYNPTRVIQRVGRINRIGEQVFDKLHIYNFFPSTTGEKEVRTRQISTLKMSMIHALLGEDTRVLTEDEELESHYNEQWRRYQEWFKDTVEEQDKSWDVEYRNLLDRVQREQPDLIEKINSIPSQHRLKRSEKQDDVGVLMFAKKGQEYTFGLMSSDGELHKIPAVDGFNLFSAKPDEKAETPSDEFDKLYLDLRQRLFSSKSDIALTGRRGNSVHKIEAIISEFPNLKEYFEDLKQIIEKYDALSEKFLKQIAAINSETLQEDVKELQNNIPHDYIQKILKKASEVEEGTEDIILSEELI